MAITTTGAKGSTKGSSAASLTISSWTLPSDCDFVAAAFGASYTDGSGDSLSTCTLGGVAATGIIQITHATNSYPIAAVAYWRNTALGSLTKGNAYNVVATHSDFFDDAVCAVQAFKGVADATAEASNTATQHDDVSGTINHSLTTLTNNAFIISCATRADNLDTWSAANSQTEIHDDSIGAGTAITLVFGYVDAGTAGSKTQGWTNAAGVRWLTSTAAIAVAPAATGTVYQLSPTVTTAATTTATVYSVVNLSAGDGVVAACTTAVSMAVVRAVAAESTSVATTAAPTATIRALAANGGNLVPEGNFSYQSDNWTLGANWQITGGAASQTAPALSSLRYAITAEVGATYRVTYTVSGNTTGSIVASIGSANGVSNGGNGTFEDVLVASTTNQLLLTASGTWDGQVDDLVLERLAPATVAMSAVRALAVQADGVLATSAVVAGLRTYTLDALVESGTTTSLSVAGILGLGEAGVVGTSTAAASVGVRHGLGAVTAAGVANADAAVEVVMSQWRLAAAVGAAFSPSLVMVVRHPTGRYATEHAAAYRLVNAVEQGDFSELHAAAFANVFRAGV